MSVGKDSVWSIISRGPGRCITDRDALQISLNPRRATLAARNAHWGALRVQLGEYSSSQGHLLSLCGLDLVML